MNKKSKKTIGMISLGCPKNIVDSEIMLGLLTNAGYAVTNNEKNSDIIIINTCGFIESAKKESIDTILEMAEYKNDKCEFLIVAGCLAERYKDGLHKAMPEVDAFIGTGGFGDIADVINALYDKKNTQTSRQIRHFPDINNISYLENKRLHSSDKGYAYLKISEGCDNRCTYCAIPAIRGRYRSRKISSIVKEAQTLAAAGKKEIIIISQDTTRYGIDIYKKRSLVKLVKAVSRIKGIEWIRLMYCYPEEIDDDLIREISENKKVCKYIDMPVQHISGRILKAMGRRGTGEYIKKLVKKIKNAAPGITLRTSLIVGFPGETDRDFNELYDFVKDTEFDRLGVFTYSREEGTKAAEMKNQVSRLIKQKRYRAIMKLQDKINRKKNKQRTGKKSMIIVNGIAGTETDAGTEKPGMIYYGRTAAEAPDIDWIVYFIGSVNTNIGDIVEAEIIDIA